METLVYACKIVAAVDVETLAAAVSLVALTLVAYVHSRKIKSLERELKALDFRERARAGER